MNTQTYYTKTLSSNIAYDLFDEADDFEEFKIILDNLAGYLETRDYRLADTQNIFNLICFNLAQKYISLIFSISPDVNMKYLTESFEETNDRYNAVLELMKKYELESGYEELRLKISVIEINMRVLKNQILLLTK